MQTQQSISTWTSSVAFCFAIVVLITTGQLSLFIFFFLFFTSGILLHLIPMRMEEKQIMKLKCEMKAKEILDLNLSTFDPWMPNSSSTCPVPEHYTVQIKINGVEYSPKKASEYNWNNVTEYRVLTIDALSGNSHSQFLNDLQGYLKGQNSLINKKVAQEHKNEIHTYTTNLINTIAISFTTATKTENHVLITYLSCIMSRRILRDELTETLFKKSLDCLNQSYSISKKWVEKYLLENMAELYYINFKKDYVYEPIVDIAVSISIQKTPEINLSDILNEKVQGIYNAIEKIQKNKLSVMSQQELTSLNQAELPKLISMYKKAENPELEAEFIEVLDKVELKIEQYNREALLVSEKEFRIHAKYMTQKY